MPKRLPEFFVIDILVSIETIQRYMKKVRNEIEFVTDEAVFKIVTRELEIIGEATGQLLKAAAIAKLVRPEWRRVVNFRNVISHEYFGLDYEEIYMIVTEKLPQFDKEVRELSRELNKEPLLIAALAQTKSDLKKIGRLKSVKFLEKFEKSLKGRKQ